MEDLLGQYLARSANHNASPIPPVLQEIVLDGLLKTRKRQKEPAKKDCLFYSEMTFRSGSSSFFEQHLKIVKSLLAVQLKKKKKQSPKDVLELTNRARKQRGEKNSGAGFGVCFVLFFFQAKQGLNQR